jgi:L-histidine Nalpha-methyltransferase
MTSQAVVPIGDELSERAAAAVRCGLTKSPKTLPPWLFYDETGSRLFEEITELPEYYLTRVERAILAEYADQILAQASDGERLRIVELGAGSAAKTRVLLSAAVERQGSVDFEPVDVSASALEEACRCIESEIAGVEVVPRVMDYTRQLELERTRDGERTLVLYIGSSIGNFEPDEATEILRGVRRQLKRGDGLLLGVDLVKTEGTLLAAYNDAAGVTAAFNLNMLTRLNRELGADFDLDGFEHRAVWNPRRSRIEMHLESRTEQTVRIPALDLTVEFSENETIHTENSYKFHRHGAAKLLEQAGFTLARTFTDSNERFAVCLARVE